MCVCVCVCVCVSAPEAMNNQWRDLWRDMKPEQPIKQVLLLYMALAIDITDGRGLSNEARR